MQAGLCPSTWPQKQTGSLNLTVLERMGVLCKLNNAWPLMQLGLMVVLPNTMEKKDAQGPVFLLWRLSLGLDPGLSL